MLKTEITPLIWGSRGIGKSQLVASLVQELHISTGKPWGLVDLRISTQEISDLTGIPKAYTWTARESEGSSRIITETDWSVPVWFPTAEKIAQKERNIPEHGIVFLDEVNRGGQQETQAIFQFVLDRRIHTHVLAPGWKIIAAANPPTQDYLVNEFDASLLDRFLQLILKPDAGEWLNWAASPDVEISEGIISFITTQPQMLYEISAEEHGWSPVITSSPRAWEAVDTIIKKCRIPDEVKTEVYAGLIGNIAAVSLVNFLQESYEQPVKASQIMKAYLQVREKIIKADEENRMDRLNMTIQDVINLARKNPEEFNIENFYLFLMDLRNDLKVALIHALLEIAPVYEIMNKNDKLVAEIVNIMREMEQTGETISETPLITA